GPAGADDTSRAPADAAGTEEPAMKPGCNIRAHGLDPGAGTTEEGGTAFGPASGRMAECEAEGDRHGSAGVQAVARGRRAAGRPGARRAGALVGREGRLEPRA